MERPTSSRGGEHQHGNSTDPDHTAAEQRMRDRQQYDRHFNADAPEVRPEESAGQQPDPEHPTAEPSTAADTRPEQGERLRRAEPRIYVACLASYNNGILHGLWIDADQEVTELQTDIVAMLASSPIPGAEEWAIHDYEGFFDFQLNEYEDLAVVSRMAKGIVEHGEAFAAYVSWAGTEDDALEHFRDHYMGTYEDEEAWVQEVADDQSWERSLDQALDPLVRPYVSIDYRGFARYVETLGWHLTPGREGVHVFAP